MTCKVTLKSFRGVKYLALSLMSSEWQSRDSNLGVGDTGYYNTSSLYITVGINISACVHSSGHI